VVFASDFVIVVVFTTELSDSLINWTVVDTVVGVPVMVIVLPSFATNV